MPDKLMSERQTPFQTSSSTQSQNPETATQADSCRPRPDGSRGGITPIRDNS